MGTPTVEDWPGFSELPWYELVKPQKLIQSQFRSAFQKCVLDTLSVTNSYLLILLPRYLSPAALNLVQSLLEYNPAKRITAADALETPFFTVEQPEKELPEYVFKPLFHYAFKLMVMLVWSVSTVNGTNTSQSESESAPNGKRSASRKLELISRVPTPRNLLKPWTFLKIASIASMLAIS